MALFILAIFISFLPISKSEDEICNFINKEPLKDYAQSEDKPFELQDYQKSFIKECKKRGDVMKI
jgi:hypothetical protein